MNNLAVLPYICLHALQIQNVKRDVVKKVSINELKNEVVYPEDLQTTHSENPHIETTTNEEMSSTNIDDLPQPTPLDNSIGSEL